MKAEYQKYILENIHKKSIRQISRDLNIRERKIQRFLKKQNEALEHTRRPEDKAKKSIKKKEIIISLALIIILGFLIYANSLTGTFRLDDQNLIIDNYLIKNGASYLRYSLSH